MNKKLSNNYFCVNWIFVYLISCNIEIKIHYFHFPFCYFHILYFLIRLWSYNSRRCTFSYTSETIFSVNAELIFCCYYDWSRNIAKTVSIHFFWLLSVFHFGRLHEFDPSKQYRISLLLTWLNTRDGREKPTAANSRNRNHQNLLYRICLRFGVYYRDEWAIRDSGSQEKRARTKMVPQKISRKDL